MAISVVMFFKKPDDRDVRTIYDAVIDEMGVRDNPAKGGIYHWCAPVDDGLRVCDVWETHEDFEGFAQEKIGPLTAKQGLQAPEVSVTPVHEMVVGRGTDHKGVGVFVEAEGDTEELFSKVDRANERMNVVADPPEGLIFHWTTATPTGICAIDHWRSREDFERFVDAKLAPALVESGMPQPRITYFDVYNTIDRRVAAKPQPA
ncbi:MAG TPA: hypothetical protein VKT72_12595 [Candidatus Baltobacteraceae bacterium]|nr:hypothetical protein [Candidatus Baltobacteraceae bacterium]